MLLRSNSSRPSRARQVHGPRRPSARPTSRARPNMRMHPVRDADGSASSPGANAARDGQELQLQTRLDPKPLDDHGRLIRDGRGLMAFPLWKHLLMPKSLVLGAPPSGSRMVLPLGTSNGVIDLGKRSDLATGDLDYRHRLTRRVDHGLLRANRRQLITFCLPLSEQRCRRSLGSRQRGRHETVPQRPRKPELADSILFHHPSLTRAARPDCSLDFMGRAVLKHASPERPTSGRAQRAILDRPDGDESRA